ECCVGDTHLPAVCVWSLWRRWAAGTVFCGRWCVAGMAANWVSGTIFRSERGDLGVEPARGDRQHGESDRQREAARSRAARVQVDEAVSLFRSGLVRVLGDLYAFA